MKRIGLLTKLIMLGAAVFMLAGCGRGDKQTVNSTADEVSVQSQTADTEDPAGGEEAEDDGETAGEEAKKDTSDDAGSNAQSGALMLEVKKTGDNTYQCTYNGIEHSMIIDLPETSEDAPMIMMLHGYGESAEKFRSDVHLEEEANPLGYAVIYVTGATDPGDSTSSTGWNSGNGNGVNRDVEFLCDLALYLENEYSFDEDRCYAAGFSNGAFMTYRLAVEAGDVFSAVVSVAGMMPEKIWNERDKSLPVSVFQVTGEKDALIPKNADDSAKYTSNPAIEDVLWHWVELDKLDEYSDVELGKGSILSKYSSENSKQQVWHLEVKGGHHGWPSESINKINMNELVMDFFETLK